MNCRRGVLESRNDLFDFFFLSIEFCDLSLFDFDIVGSNNFHWPSFHFIFEHIFRLGGSVCPIFV